MLGFVAAASLVVSSQITDVTVFSDRAQVTRSAEVQLEPGINKLVFEDLPEAIDSRSIQVEGAGAATVFDVRFKTEHFKEVPEEAWKEFYDRRDELREQQALLEQKRKRFVEAKAFLRQISSKVTHKAEKEGELALDPGSWESMLALYTAKNEEYDEGVRVTGLELKELEKALKKVEAEIREAGADTRKKRRVVEVDVETEKSGKTRVYLSYLVAGPRWLPTYDIRVDTASRSMQVNYFALVAQNTGEDWGSVALKLSTANPGLGGQHPELDPWRIRIRQPVPKSLSASSVRMPEVTGLKGGLAMRNLFESDTEDFWGDAVAEPAPALRKRMTTAALKGASVVFAVPGRSAIGSDNVEHRVAVASADLPATFRYSAIPKLAPHAYLKAKATNSGAHPFLAGKANVFLDGSFVAVSSLELIAPDEEFWVFLGADESMKIEHKLIKKYQSREGLVGKVARHEYEYLMSVKNTHAVAEEIIVWDQLPISGSEGLKVKLLEPKYSKDTDSLKIDDEKRISWMRTLNAGEEWAIPFRFHVEAPKGMKIDGLE